MKITLFLLGFVLTTYPAQASDSLLVRTCKTKGSSFTVSIAKNSAPSSRIETNIHLTQFSVNPDGTARVVSDDAETTLSRIFDTPAKALSFFRTTDVMLKNSEGTQFVFSVRGGFLMILDSEEKTAKSLPCHRSI